MPSLSVDTNYRPTDDEPFMNERQRDYFRRKLNAWKADILREAQDTIANLQAENENHPDYWPISASSENRSCHPDTCPRSPAQADLQDRCCACARLDDGSYGYCEETGEPISLKRLDARPIATLSLEAQERRMSVVSGSIRDD